MPLFPVDSIATSRSEVSDRVGYPFEFALGQVEFDPLRDLVVAAGSIVEGLANAHSDLDLFVVTGRPSGRRDDIWFWLQAERWVDVTHVEACALEGLRRRIEDHAAERVVDWGACPTFATTQLDLYHRMATGVGLTSPLEPPLDLSRFQRAALGRALSKARIVPARARWADAVGAHASRQYGQAAHVGRIALELAAEAYLALNGQTNPNGKWLWAKAERLSQDPLDLRRFAVWPPSEEIEERARRVIVAAAEVLFQATHLHVFGKLGRWDPSLRMETRLEAVADGIYAVDALGRGRVAAS